MEVEARGKSNFIGIYPIDGIWKLNPDRLAVETFVTRAVNTNPGYIKVHKDHIVVELDDTDTAIRCYKELNGQKLIYALSKKKKEIKVRIEIFRPYHGRTQWIEMSPLNPAVTAKTLCQHIQKRGEIHNALKNVWLRPERGSRPRWALIEFKSYKEAESASNQLNGWERSPISLNGKTLKVDTLIQREVCRHRDLEGKTRRVLFHRLHRLMNRVDLATLCSKFGRVRRCFVVITGGGGIAIGGVEMMTMKGAKAVFNEFHGKMLSHLRIHTQYVHPLHPFYFEHFDSGDIVVKKSKKKKKKISLKGESGESTNGMKAINIEVTMEEMNTLSIRMDGQKKKERNTSRLEKKIRKKGKKDSKWSWDLGSGIKTF